MQFFLRIFVLLAFWVPCMGVAQENTAPVAVEEVVPSHVVRLEDGQLDLQVWQSTADRIETALGVGRASDSVFQLLREQLVEWRAAFSEAVSENNIHINTLETQISTLGPPPAEGDTEPAILTQRRSELNVLLSEARAPVQAAEEGFSRADVLISEIDALIRARETDALISLGPLPVNPASWPAALRSLHNTFDLAASAMAASWGTEIQRAEMQRGLPMTVLLLVVGAVLLVRGRVWIMRLGARVFRRANGAVQGVLGFVISLGQVAAPLFGIFALLEALNRAGILDLRAQAIADTLPWLGLTFFAGLWLGNRVFGAPTTAHVVVSLPEGARPTQGRLALAVLGLIYGLNLLLQSIASHDNYSAETQSVLGFVLVVAAGLILIRLGLILRATELVSGVSTGLRHYLVRKLGQVLIVLGVVAPLAGAIGYMALAERMIYPAILTLGLLAFLEVAHLFFTDLYWLISGRKEGEAREALTPILASFALVIASLPVAALIWGARVTDLTELWATFGQGFQLGDTRVTPGTFLTFAIIFAIGYVATRLVQSTLKNSILPKTRMDKGGQNAVISGLGYVGIFLAAVIAITGAGVDLSSLAIVAGALSVGIGFGLQNVVSNFVSGIILLVERPISEGDWIEVGGQMGYVRDISVRSTRIETFDRTDVVVPNSDLISGVVTNFTRGNLIGRVIVPVGVAYGTDTREVEKILREVAQAHPVVTVDPAPSVVFQGFGADALEFEIRAILKDVNFVLSVKSDLNHEIARRFGEAGIEIPFAQRDIWLRNPEALAGRGQGEGGAIDPGEVGNDPDKARAALSESDLDTGSAEGGQDGDR